MTSNHLAVFFAAVTFALVFYGIMRYARESEPETVTIDRLTYERLVARANGYPPPPPLNVRVSKGVG